MKNKPAWPEKAEQLWMKLEDRCQIQLSRTPWSEHPYGPRKMEGVGAAGGRASLEYSRSVDPKTPDALEMAKDWYMDLSQSIGTRLSKAKFLQFSPSQRFAHSGRTVR